MGDQSMLNYLLLLTSEKRVVDSMKWGEFGSFWLTLKLPVTTIVCLCLLQTVWTQIRLLLLEQSDLGPQFACMQK